MSQHSADQPDVPRPPLEPREQPRTRESSKGPLPPFKVVLHSDAGKDLMFVVRTVMELTRFCRAEATHKMWESYHCSSSILLTTYKERAELLHELFSARGLKVGLEST